MSEQWKQWEARTVEGKFPLQTYLGGSDHSAVFLTSSAAGDSEKAIIKLIPADSTDAENQLQRWKAARELDHPNLIRIFEMGRCEFDGTAMLYVVEEFAEENLAQILPDRGLTAEEARGMLSPVLKALQYLRDKGFVHGRIQPSNILAVQDQVKLSSDSLQAQVLDKGIRSARPASAYDPPEAAAGEISAAGDIWQLGMTLVEVLTQYLPAWDRIRPGAPQIPPAVSGPLREIAEHCLQVDPAKRWTVGKIVGRLATGTSSVAETTGPLRAAIGREVTPSPIPTRQRATAKWPYFLGVAALAAAAIFFFARPKPSSPTSEQAPVVTESKPALAPAAGVDEKAPAKANATSNRSASDSEPESGVVRRVEPQVSTSARRTIQGKIKVRVRVEVDAAGNVAKAALESAGPSKYFSRISLEAARDWKFSPAPPEASGARQWKLQFAFTRSQTEVSAARGNH